MKVEPVVFDTNIRPKFAKYTSQDPIADYIAEFRESAIQMELIGAVKLCRDPDDDKVLECAWLGRANCIVTGDKDLTVLRQFRGIEIVLPHDYLDAIVTRSP
jgi:uncharacterized protein